VKNAIMRKETSTNFSNEQKILESCAIAYTISLIGGRWKPTILWQLMQGTVRYKELKELIPGITERMLTISLKELEKDGLIQKNTHTAFPRKIEYSLTESGWSMESMLRGLSEWGRGNKSST
jgi:DNA-binding HxlR family transcriptional regulator